MRNRSGTEATRRGFTILELLVVISIMAVIATLATGAALKAVKQSRNKRIEASCRALEMALMNYRAQENAWPVTLRSTGNSTTVWYHGEANKEVFKPMYQGSGGSRTAYFDASSLMGEYHGRRAVLRSLLDAKVTDVPLVYQNPDETSRINYYCVEFNLITDSVKVHVQHEKDRDHNCPNYDYDNHKQR